MSSTPRTDAELEKRHEPPSGLLWASFARELEQELNRAAADNLHLLELLRECERTLAMVPANNEPVPGWLRELHKAEVAPMIQKIRDEFA